MNEKFKRTAFIQTGNLFKQYKSLLSIFINLSNTSLLNKYTNLFKKEKEKKERKCTDPKLLIYTHT